MAATSILTKDRHFTPFPFLIPTDKRRAYLFFNFINTKIAFLTILVRVSMSYDFFIELAAVNLSPYRTPGIIYEPLATPWFPMGPYEEKNY